MAGAQDDDVAYGADQLLFQVQAIMATPEVTVWLTPGQIRSITGDMQRVGNALRAYRDKFGMTERRATSPQVVSSVRDLKVQAGSMAVAMGRVGALAGTAGTAESGGVVSGLVRALTAAGVAEFAWAVYFSQLDDSPSQYRDYGVNQVRANLSASVTSLTSDFSELQDLSSMAMTAEQAQNATDDQLLKALVDAINSSIAVSAKIAIINVVIMELSRRYGQCLTIINSIRDQVLRINRLRSNPGATPGSLVSNVNAISKAVNGLKNLFQSCAIASGRILGNDCE